MELKNVAPWGRTFGEYREMFSLTHEELTQKILGCGDGPASFNAELTSAGGRVVSADPVYAFSGIQIRRRIEEVYPHILSQMKKTAHGYIWDTIPSIEALGNLRMNAMEIFLKDYEAENSSGRYVVASLPELPFEEQAFDLALCSHYLFLYSAHVTTAEHVASLKTLCRVAVEVRVYPLLSLDGTRSQHLEPVISELEKTGIDVSLTRVAYEFRKGATEMLVARRR